MFFKNYLISAGKGTFWMPDIYSISDFIEKFSGLERADPIDISFELYDLYCSLSKNSEKYDDFYYWGEMMIRDFDDIDKYMVDAEQLFLNLSGLKEIDNFLGGFEKEQVEVIREFWKHFDRADQSDEQRNFLETWRNLLPLYDGLSKRLIDQGTGYEGMQYRKIAGNILKGNFPDFHWNKMIIAGFNALNTAEKIIFRHVRDAGKALFFWDYDVQYTDNRITEAGRFLRKNMEEFPSPEINWGFTMLQDKKNIQIYELPSDILQARQIGRILAENTYATSMDFDNTAVILGDENLLEPVISSLPENIPYINITMGYPINHTTAFSFVDHLLNLQKNLSLQKNRKTVSFYYRDIISILNHQYLHRLKNPELKEMIGTIQSRNLIYLSPGFFSSNAFLEKIFRRIEKAEDMSAYLRDILEYTISLKSSGEEAENNYNLEKEYVFFILTRINKLEKVFSEDRTEMGIETYVRLFRKILQTSKIPFEGEPLQGLQVMGILESRLIDFRNIIFLSMNEGVMPRSQSLFSFVPVNLRFAFNMPVREDHDAIYAYYFYRLLQRAENIYILYNSKTDGLKTGEKSRYIYQLEYLNPSKPELKTIAFRISNPPVRSVTIYKTNAIINQLNEFTGTGTRALSPTAITSWLDCKLRFYFTYIAGLREQDEVVEDIDAPLLGNILHHAMKLIYANIQGRALVADDLNKLLIGEEINRVINEAFIIEFKRGETPDESVFTPEGRNIIVYEVIKKLIGNILDFDKKQLPFTVLETEKMHRRMITVDEKQVRLGGVTDRMDLRGDIVHIIDYKTGNVDTEFPSVKALFDTDARERHKEIIQILIYSWLCEDSLSGQHKMSPCIYATRAIHRHNYVPYITLKDGRGGKAVLIKDYRVLRDEFTDNLKNMIRDLFNPEIPFVQTNDKMRCRYCIYKAICHRD